MKKPEVENLLSDSLYDRGGDAELNYLFQSGLTLEMVMMILSTRMRLLLLPLFVFAIQIQSEFKTCNLKGQSMGCADHSPICLCFPWYWSFHIFGIALNL
jgi:hypothetical protein